MMLSARQVRKWRLYIADNRCPLRPGLTHDWEAFEYVRDTSTLAPAAEIGYHCTKCGEEDL